MRLTAIALLLVPLVGVLFFPACVSLQQPEKKAITQITAKNAGYLVAQKFGGQVAEILKYTEEVLTLPGESPEGCFKKWSGYVIDQVIEDPYVSMNVKSLVEIVDIEIEDQESVTAKWDLIRELLDDFKIGMKAAR